MVNHRLTFGKYIDTPSAIPVEGIFQPVVEMYSTFLLLFCINAVAIIESYNERR